MIGHSCQVDGCDGTRLGHDLAVEFPDETARVDEALARLRDRGRWPELRVDPDNLAVDGDDGDG